jgi:uncharacterized protein YuzE
MHREIITIQSSTPPVIELDPAVSAWYVRFSRAKVVKTLSEDKPGPVVTIDLDARGKVVGIEIIGVREFSIQTLIKLARIEAPNVDFSRARFVNAGTPDLQAA